MSEVQNFADRITIDNETRMLKDTPLTEQVEDLKSALNSIGLDIDDGILVISPVTE